MTREACPSSPSTNVLSCSGLTVQVDGAIVRGCLTLACQTAGTRVDTVEGLTDSGAIADLQAAFHQRNALQCGYCTPGMLVSAEHGNAFNRAFHRRHVEGGKRCGGGFMHAFAPSGGWRR